MLFKGSFIGIKSLRNMIVIRMKLWWKHGPWRQYINMGIHLGVSSAFFLLIKSYRFNIPYSSVFDFFTQGLWLHSAISFFRLFQLTNCHLKCDSFITLTYSHYFYFLVIFESLNYFCHYNVLYNELLYSLSQYWRLWLIQWVLVLFTVRNQGLGAKFVPCYECC